MENKKILKRIGDIGILPVITISDTAQAFPLAKALVEGNIPAIEVTLRTPGALDSIKIISENYPDMILGAGTVLTPGQADRAIESGADFIVSPGFDRELVRYCLDKSYNVIPGVSNASEIQQALAMGITTVKFFPAERLGGVETLKLLHGPFPDVRFIVTGGITPQNYNGYLALPYVTAVGGSFVASGELVKAGEFEKITEICKNAISGIFDFRIAHIGINCNSADESMNLAKILSGILNVPVIEHPGCNFAGTLFEVNKAPGRGNLGHIGLITNDLQRAAAFIENMGVELDWEKALYFPDGKKVLCVYFKNDIAGFAFHLLQKK